MLSKEALYIYSEQSQSPEINEMLSTFLRVVKPFHDNIPQLNTLAFKRKMLTSRRLEIDFENDFGIKATVEENTAMEYPPESILPIKLGTFRLGNIVSNQFHLTIHIFPETVADCLQIIRRDVDRMHQWLNAYIPLPHIFSMNIAMARALLDQCVLDKSPLSFCKLGLS